MKRKEREGSLHKRLQKQMVRHKSSLNMKESSTSRVRSVIREAPPRPEHPSSTLLYDSVHTCPLSAYIDAVCDDRLESLIIEGKPSREELEEARFKLVTGFSEMSNQGEASAFCEVMGNYYYQRGLLLGYELSLKLIISGRYDAALEYLKGSGLDLPIPETKEELEKLIKTIELKMKNRIVKYKEAKSAYKALSSRKGEKPTRRYYSKLLVILSTSEVIKIQLSAKKMTVAEFADYLNIYNEYQNQLKFRKHAR